MIGWQYLGCHPQRSLVQTPPLGMHLIAQHTRASATAHAGIKPIFWQTIWRCITELPITGIGTAGLVLRPQGHCVPLLSPEPDPCAIVLQPPLLTEVPPIATIFELESAIVAAAACWRKGALGDEACRGKSTNTSHTRNTTRLAHTCSRSMHVPPHCTTNNQLQQCLTLSQNS